MNAGSKAHSIGRTIGLVLATLGLVAALLLPTATAAQESARLRVWHFAEGLTRADIQSYFLVHNLEDRPTSVRAEYQREDGVKLTQNFGVPPRGRVSIGAGDLLGPTAFGVSFGFASSIRATVPATTGVAILVPLKVKYGLPLSRPVSPPSKPSTR